MNGHVRPVSSADLQTQVGFNQSAYLRFPAESTDVLFVDSLERLQYASSLLGIDLLKHRNVGGVDSTARVIGNSRVDACEHGDGDDDVNHSIVNQASDSKKSESIYKYSLTTLTKKFNRCHASSLLPPRKSFIQVASSPSPSSPSSSSPSIEDGSRVFRHVVGLDAEWKSFNAGCSGGCSILQVTLYHTHLDTPNS